MLAAVILYICNSLMKNILSYTRKDKLSSLFMILALLWLTVSIPFVYTAQQQMEYKAAIEKNANSCDDESSNPLANTTEEKAPSSGINTLTEEYLHHTDDLFHALEILLSHRPCHTVAEYLAFHGELLCPPPNA